MNVLGQDFDTPTPEREPAEAAILFALAAGLGFAQDEDGTLTKRNWSKMGLHAIHMLKDMGYIDEDNCVKADAPAWVELAWTAAYNASSQL